MRRKVDWFLLGMVAVMVLAWIAPDIGATGGVLKPEVTMKAGIALLFFLHGVALPLAALHSGLMNWRLHLFVQTCTFVFFPLLGIGLLTMGGGFGSEPMRTGIFYLCALPSTVSSSVAMTAAARGNVAGAVFNATLSSVIGVVLTPLWVVAILKTQGQAQRLYPVIMDLVRWLILPLALGQACRPWLGAWIGRHRSGIHFVDRATILFLVYTSFCDSVVGGVWTSRSATELLAVGGLCAGILALAIASTSWLARVLKFPDEDRIAAVFCGSKKTLAAGVPMAKLIFGAHPALGLILLPILIYHPIQLAVCGVLAQRWASRADPA